MTLNTKPMKLPTNTSMPHIKEIIVNSSIDCLSYELKTYVKLGETEDVSPRFCLTKLLVRLLN